MSAKTNITFLRMYWPKRVGASTSEFKVRSGNIINGTKVQIICASAARIAHFKNLPETSAKPITTSSNARRKYPVLYEITPPVMA